jgi:ribosomal protein S18 acetylase RimI-like enzyme
VQIRAACSRDVDAVLALWTRARTAAATTADTPEGVERVIAREALLVAESGGEVVGTLIAGFDGWRGFLHRLAVAPEHRRRGIAMALVDAGLERLRAQGAPRVNAIVGGEDANARAFWVAAGFEHDDSVARFVTNLRTARG